MIEVIIGYQVDDKEGRSFRPLSDIARDVESEFLSSALFFRSKLLQNYRRK